MSKSAYLPRAINMAVVAGLDAIEDFPGIEGHEEALHNLLYGTIGSNGIFVHLGRAPSIDTAMSGLRYYEEHYFAEDSPTLEAVQEAVFAFTGAAHEQLHQIQMDTAAELHALADAYRPG